MTSLGLDLVAVVAAQVITAIAEGLSPNAGQTNPTGPGSIETDLLHRLGFPFGSLGPTTMLLLLVGMVLLALPAVLGRRASPLQEKLATVALWTVVALAVIVAIGSLLAVRNSLHEYTARGQNPPQFVRIGYAAFLVATLGTAATALFGALSAMNLRRRRES